MPTWKAVLQRKDGAVLHAAKSPGSFPMPQRRNSVPAQKHPTRPYILEVLIVSAGTTEKCCTALTFSSPLNDHAPMLLAFSRGYKQETSPLSRCLNFKAGISREFYGALITQLPLYLSRVKEPTLPWLRPSSRGDYYTPWTLLGLQQLPFLKCIQL